MQHMDITSNSLRLPVPLSQLQNKSSQVFQRHAVSKKLRHMAKCLLKTCVLHFLLLRTGGRDTQGCGLPSGPSRRDEKEEKKEEAE
ncbi:hypothetical protein MHYP_G00042030 [Metynnis hypsauchen]